ncbi:glutathione S-transferase T3-like [Chenopodium quinoa]|uniref:glutathione S-transferase T3-like n=1 Tax=Chenopodium quinoa TaxID=63459 RepID=UPI000B78C117|nr:glutathione S-transferase T3-like [Chenopodium quinoa]
MDPNNPFYSILSQNCNDLDENFMNQPQFQLFLQRLSNTSLQNPPQQQIPPQLEIPPQIPTENTDYEQSPPVYQGSNSQYDDSQEENVPETPQYPPSTQRMPVGSNQQLAKASRIWLVAENEALIGLYLKYSGNAIVGTGMKAAELWRQISVAYDMVQAKQPEILPPRNAKSLENRWRRMAADVLLWTTCYDEASPLTGSGFNEVDRIQKASKLFHISSKPPHNLVLPHAWEMKKNDPKWRPKLRWALSLKERQDCQLRSEGDIEDSSGSGKRSRTDSEAEGDVPVGGFSSGGIPRPDGVKKAKAKRKGKTIAHDSAILSIGELIQACTEVRSFEANLRQQRLDLEREKEKRKNKQVELQEKKMKFDMLQAIMSKTTPLTPAEEAWKEELIQEVYGGK